MEYAAGGELFNMIATKGRFTEDVARYYFQQLVAGVEYCHSQVQKIAALHSLGIIEQALKGRETCNHSTLVMLETLAWTKDLNDLYVGVVEMSGNEHHNQFVEFRNGLQYNNPLSKVLRCLDILLIFL